MSVKRYDYGMVSDEGMWVQYPDYAALETRVKELTDERDRLEKAVSWSWIRNLLEHGRSIQLDVQAGHYDNYELLSARVDAAARERLDELKQNLTRAEAARKGE